MSTAIIYVTGTAKWCRVYEGQMDTKYGEKFHLTVYPDEASLVTLKTSGSRVKKHDDEEGTFFKFSRDNKKVFKDEEEVLGPPKVIDADGKPFDKIIGNGSTVTCKLAIYDSKFGKGTRLEAVRVDKHVPYEAAEGGDAAEYPF